MDECCAHDLLHRILRKLEIMEEKMATSKEQLEAGIDELNEKITAIGDSLVDLASDVSAAFEELKSQIGQPNAVDLGPLLEKVGTAISKLSAFSAGIKNLDVAAEEITGKPTPPPPPPPAEPETPVA